MIVAGVYGTTVIAPRFPNRRAANGCARPRTIRHKAPNPDDGRGHSFALKLRPPEFKWEIYHVAWQANFEAKRSNESRNGIGSRWGVVAGGRHSEAAVGPVGDTPTLNTAITLDEEEISDVSLSTFYVFEHENAGAHRPGLQLAKRTRGHGGSQFTEAAEGAQ
jgi:hypothetical protein